MLSGVALIRSGAGSNRRLMLFEIFGMALSRLLRSLSSSLLKRFTITVSARRGMRLLGSLAWTILHLSLWAILASMLRVVFFRAIRRGETVITLYTLLLLRVLPCRAAKLSFVLSEFFLMSLSL